MSLNTDTSLFAAADLFVVGNINRDIKTAPFAPGDFLFEDGENSLDGVKETIGGGGANAAATAASLGSQVAFASKIGADALGDRLEEAMRGRGVRCYLARDAACVTGTSIALNYRTGRRHFLSCLPNNTSLQFEDLDLSSLEDYRHLYRADIWFSEPMLFGGNRRLFETARSAGLTISVDLNWDPKWNVAPPGEIRTRKEAVREVLPLVHLAHGNVRELNELADSNDLATTLKRLTDWGVKAVIVHLGREGAGYFAQDSLRIQEPAPTRRILQTTGTGDVLSVAMMLMESRAEMPVQERLKVANQIVAEFMEGRRQFIPELY